MDRIREATPRSRGAVRCDFCNRIIPRGERYRRDVYADCGDIWDVRECCHCTVAFEHVMDWADDPYGEDEYGREALWEWSSEVMGDHGGVPWGVCAPTQPSLWRIRLQALADVAADCGADDADPALAWDEAAWAAFTWRMRTSPAMNAA